MIVNSSFQFNQYEFHWQTLGKVFSRVCFQSPKISFSLKVLAQCRSPWIIFLLIVPRFNNPVAMPLLPYIPSGKICLSLQPMSLVPVPCYSSSSSWNIGSVPQRHSLTLVIQVMSKKVYSVENIIVLRQRFL